MFNWYLPGIYKELILSLLKHPVKGSSYTCLLRIHKIKLLHNSCNKIRLLNHWQAFKSCSSFYPEKTVSIDPLIAKSLFYNSNGQCQLQEVTVKANSISIEQIVIMGINKVQCTEGGFESPSEKSVNVNPFIA